MFGEFVDTGGTGRREAVEGESIGSEADTINIVENSPRY